MRYRTSRAAADVENDGTNSQLYTRLPIECPCDFGT